MHVLLILLPTILLNITIDYTNTNTCDISNTLTNTNFANTTTHTTTHTLPQCDGAVSRGVFVVYFGSQHSWHRPPDQRHRFQWHIGGLRQVPNPDVRGVPPKGRDRPLRRLRTFVVFLGACRLRVATRPSFSRATGGLFGVARGQGKG